MGSDRTLLAIAGAIGALIVAAIVLVVVAGDRPLASFPPGSPEATVQAYLAAWEDEDYAAAYAFFSAEVKDRVSIKDFERAAEEQQSYSSGDTRRVFIDRVEDRGERADVHLTIEHSYPGGPFGPNTYREARVLRLVRESGAWRIDEALLGLDPGPFFPPEKFLE